MVRKLLTPSCHSNFTEKMAIKWKIKGQIHSLKGTAPENNIDIVYTGKRKQKKILHFKHLFHCFLFFTGALPILIWNCQ